MGGSIYIYIYFIFICYRVYIELKEWVCEWEWGLGFCFYTRNGRDMVRGVSGVSFILSV